MGDPRLTLPEDRSQEIADPLVVLEDDGARSGLLREGDFEPPVQVAGDFQPLANGVGVEGGLGKHRWIGAEEYFAASPSSGPQLLQLGDRSASTKLDLPGSACTFDGRHQLRR